MPTAQSSDTQKQLIEKILRGQRHAGSGVWHQGGVASKRTEEQTAEITNAIAISSRFNIQAIRNSAARLIKEEDKDDERDAQNEELERKKQEENEREKKQGGFFAGLGGLLKTIAMGKDGKGEAGWFKGGLLGFGKGMFKGIGKVFSILWSVLKWIGGPLLLMGTLAFLTADEKTQQEMIKGITAGLEKVWNWLQYLAGAFKEGFMGNMEGEDGLKKKWAEFQTAWKLAVNSFDDIKFGKNAEGQPYTGLAGIAEWLGDISAQIAGLFIDLGTGVANLIADPAKFIGELEGKIMTMFDDLGALISDFWYEGIANPRTWRKVAQDAGITSEEALSAVGLGKEDMQKEEAKKKQLKETENKMIDIEIKRLQDLTKVKNTYSVMEMADFHSRIVRLQGEKERNEEAIKRIDQLKLLDDRGAAIEQLRKESIEKYGVDLVGQAEAVMAAEAGIEKFHAAPSITDRTDRFEKKSGVMAGEKVLKGETHNVGILFGDMIKKISQWSGGKIKESDLAKMSKLEIMMQWKSVIKDRNIDEDIWQDALESIVKTESGWGVEQDVKYLDALIDFENQKLIRLKKNLHDAKNKQNLPEEFQKKLQLLYPTTKDDLTSFQLNKTNNLGIPSLVSNDAGNAGEGAGAVVYNMGGNVTDQSKKSVFMFPERHLFGERLQLGRV